MRKRKPRFLGLLGAVKVQPQENYGTRFDRPFLIRFFQLE